MSLEKCKSCLCFSCKNNFVNKENYTNPCEHCYKCIGMSEKNKKDNSNNSCDKYVISEYHSVLRRRKMEKILGEKTL